MVRAYSANSVRVTVDWSCCRPRASFGEAVQGVVDHHGRRGLGRGQAAQGRVEHRPLGKPDRGGGAGRGELEPLLVGAQPDRDAKPVRPDEDAQSEWHPTNAGDKAPGRWIHESGRRSGRLDHHPRSGSKRRAPLGHPGHPHEP
jgi:hypothetical protein